MVNQFIRLLLFLLSICGLAHSAKCRSVSLESGGSHGAYETGVLWQLVESLPAADVAWDVVTGVSTGSLNTFGVAQFAPGDEKAMVDYIQSIWLNIGSSSSIFVEWPGGLAAGLLTKPSLYDTSPLRATLQRSNKHGINRKFVVGTTNLDTGSFKNFDESVGNSLFVDVVMASAAAFGFFPPITVEGVLYSDGGAVLNLDVFSGVERCLEVVSDQSDVVVDMIYDNYNRSLSITTEFNTIDVLLRVRHIRSIDSVTWYTYAAHNAYSDVSFRYTIYPSQKMPGGVEPLNFSRAVMEAEIALGKEDAKKAIEQGENGREVIAENYRRMRSNIFYATD